MMANYTKILVFLLVIGNLIAFILGVTIFGLAVGTSQSSVFLLGMPPILKPLWDMACADIAAGAFICTAAVASVHMVSAEKHINHVVNFWGLIILILYTVAVGITTLEIASEKMPAMQYFTVAICMSIWGPRSPLSRLDGRPGTFVDLDVFRPNPVPKTYDDCNYFDDLMTPCGALLLVAAIVQSIVLFCSGQLWREVLRNREVEEVINDEEEIINNRNVEEAVNRNMEHIPTAIEKPQVIVLPPEDIPPV